MRASSRLKKIVDEIKGLERNEFREYEILREIKVFIMRYGSLDSLALSEIEKKVEDRIENGI